VVIELLMVAGVVLVALPALWLGARGLTLRTGHYSSDAAADRLSLVLLVTLRALVLLLVLVLSALTLVCAVGAVVRDLQLPSLVSVFFVLDLLLATLVMLTFGHRARRRPRRRATPAAR
jgi:hypothetical protein